MITAGLTRSPFHRRLEIVTAQAWRRRFLRRRKVAHGTNFRGNGEVGVLPPVRMTARAPERPHVLQPALVRGMVEANVASRGGPKPGCADAVAVRARSQARGIFDLGFRLRIIRPRYVANHHGEASDLPPRRS